jgi:putative peptide zinc metalloprotease protein
MQKILPRFRNDLNITSRISSGGGFNYVIKDPSSNDFYEFGEEEFFICKQLDGRTSLESIQIAFENHFGFPFELNQLEAFINQLSALGLLFVGKETASYVSWSSSRQVKLRPLFDPNRLLGLLAKYFSWCFSRFFLICSCIVILLGFGVMFKYFSVFANESPIIWQPGPFFLETALGLFVINVLEEISKGVACKYYGGNVYEFGVWFSYRMIPHPYVDISDAFWSLSRSDRMRVFFSGLFLQTLVLGLAIIVWRHTISFPSLHTFSTIFILAAFFFMLLNLIPLFPRDGYILMSMWLEVADIYNRSRALCRSWIFRRPLPEPLSTREILGFKWYGVLSVGLIFILWTLFIIMLGILLIWQWKLKGVGACIFLVFLTLRFEDQIKGWIMRIPGLRGILADKIKSIKFTRMVKWGLLALFIVIMLLPYPFEPGGDFKLIPIKQLAIRAEVPGQIYSVLVKENQWVNEGQQLVILSDKDQQTSVKEAKAAYEAAVEKLKMYYLGPSPEQIAMAEQEVKVTAKSLEFSTVEADRAAKMFTEKAIADKDYQAYLKTRDEDREKYILAKKNLDVVKSWPRPEEIKMQEAEVQRLKAELDLAEKNLHLTKLVSPMEGKIISAYPFQTVGQFLAVGDVFAIVEDTRTILAEIEVPEEDFLEEVRIGARVKLKTWAYPTKTFYGKVIAIAPTGYDKSKHHLDRVPSEKEWRFSNKEALPDNGKVIRVLSEFPNPDGLLKTDMTGYAKINGRWMPVGVAFTRWLVRFIMVEVWSWIP